MREELLAVKPGMRDGVAAGAEPDSVEVELHEELTVEPLENLIVGSPGPAMGQMEVFEVKLSAELEAKPWRVLDKELLEYLKEVFEMEP